MIVSFLLTVLLTAVPIIYDRWAPRRKPKSRKLTHRWDRLKRPAQFLAVSRSLLILHAFGTGLMLLAAFIVTISGELSDGTPAPVMAHVSVDSKGLQEPQR